MLGHSGGFRLPNTLSSYKLANVINMRYHTIRMIPYFLSSFQPLRWVANTRNKTVESRERVEYVSPARNTSVHKINAQIACQFCLSLHPSIGLHIFPPELVTVNVVKVAGLYQSYVTPCLYEAQIRLHQLP